MELSSTKANIIDAALTLFSEYGYEAVSVAQIAAAIGIKAPSLYKHFQSKRDIFEAIRKEMDERYLQKTSAMQMDGTDPSLDFTIFRHVSEGMLVDMGKSLFLYFLNDDYVKRFRKMMTIEQFSNHDLSQLYTTQYVDDPLTYQGMMLGMLAQNGLLKQEDARIMALHFYAPLYLLLTLCDRQPQREEEALQLLEQHIKQFNRLYLRKEESL